VQGSFTGQLRNGSEKSSDEAGTTAGEAEGGGGGGGTPPDVYGTTAEGTTELLRPRNLDLTAEASPRTPVVLTLMTPEGRVAAVAAVHLNLRAAGNALLRRRNELLPDMQRLIDEAPGIQGQVGQAAGDLRTAMSTLGGVYETSAIESAAAAAAVAAATATAGGATDFKSAGDIMGASPAYSRSTSCVRPTFAEWGSWGRAWQILPATSFAPILEPRFLNQMASCDEARQRCLPGPLPATS